MTDYQIGSTTRRCSQTGRELKVGERYCSVLLQEGGSLVRKARFTSRTRQPKAYEPVTEPTTHRRDSRNLPAKW